MKKTSIVLSFSILFLTLTTINPSKFKLDIKYFQAKEIEVSNTNIIKRENIINYIESNYDRINLLTIDEKMLSKLYQKYEIIDFIEIKKIYPKKINLKIKEKKIIAILSDQKKFYYITEDGESIKYFENSKLKNLPNIVGGTANFIELYRVLKKNQFPINQIKSFYFFNIGRWDIILKNDITIKLPQKKYDESIKNYIELYKNKKFEKYLIFDYRIKDQIILK